jgi:hypothetical protein
LRKILKKVEKNETLMDSSAWKTLLTGAPAVIKVGMIPPPNVKQFLWPAEHVTCGKDGHVEPSGRKLNIENIKNIEK